MEEAEATEINKEAEVVSLGELQELEQTLDKVQIDHSASNTTEHRHKVDPSECPASYSENSPEEKLLQSMAENLHSQISYLYPDRKPLLLCPVNECGTQKFVSTTLRRTLLPYHYLYDWQGCASFISDFLTLELLDCPTTVPKQLCSPTLVVQTRRGTSFEFSTLLCSLLLGAGYNAYCVSGYAVKEMCLFDLSQEKCPLLKLKDMAEGKLPEQKEEAKYRVKPARELKSKFEQHQKQKNLQELHTLQEHEEQKDEQKYPPDPLWGQRVHSWVLVLAGKRDITENFFVDPLSGQNFPTSSMCFLGIESIWNCENYWVNLQDCRFGCMEMTYDLHDVLKWECMLYGPTSEQQEEKNDEETEDEVFFEMPRSWVTQIHILEEDIESRLPGGSVVTHYRKAKLEKFSPYLLNDGLVTRLTTYDDLECTQINTVKEWYENRYDELQERELKKGTNDTVEHYSLGRSFGLKTHRYVTHVTGMEQHMEFYSNVREDNLVSRVNIPSEMIETFKGRSDFLYYRHVIYKLAKKLELHQPIQMVTMKFHRDRSKPASQDVAELIFQISQNRIEVTYHLDDDEMIPNFHIFDNILNHKNFSNKMVSSFQVDPLAKPFSKLYLYQTLMALKEEEEKVLVSIKDSENEVRDILEVRNLEESAIMLKISIYNIARNEKAGLHVEQLNQLAREKKLKKEYDDEGILAPFMAQLGDPECLTKPKKVQIHRMSISSKHNLRRRRKSSCRPSSVTRRI